jgi:hypothetical protein
MMLFGVLDSGNVNPFYAIADFVVSSASPNFDLLMRNEPQKLHANTEHGSVSTHKLNILRRKVADPVPWRGD